MSAIPGACEGLRVEQDGPLLLLTLDREARRNALDDTMVAGLIGALEAAGQDESVRAVLLRAEGEHFCSGFDLATRGVPGADASRPRVGSMQRRLPAGPHRLIPLLCSVQVPVVCAVQGWAAGIGLHLVLAADFAVVADDARLWEPFMQRGFTPDSGGTWLLTRRIGEVRAREMVLLGREVGGAEAAEWGLVHRAVPRPELADAAGDLARELAAGPTVALGLAKALLHRGSDRGLEDHLADEALALEISSRSEDFREGMRAFSERRPPEFRGR